LYKKKKKKLITAADSTSENFIIPAILQI